jgi:hypothetical protein
VAFGKVILKRGLSYSPRPLSQVYRKQDLLADRGLRRIVSLDKLLTKCNYQGILSVGRSGAGRNPWMDAIERSPGEGVRIGPYTLRVLSVDADKVVFALLDPDLDCCCCGERPADHRRCPVCATEAVVCTDCAGSWQCPRCASHLE